MERNLSSDVFSHYQSRIRVIKVLALALFVAGLLVSGWLEGATPKLSTDFRFQTTGANESVGAALRHDCLGAVHLESRRKAAPTGWVSWFPGIKPEDCERLRDTTEFTTSLEGVER